jgi:flagellar basal body-associated protein FliL
MDSKLMIGSGVLLLAVLGGGAYVLRGRFHSAARSAAVKTPEPKTKVAYVDAKELTLRLADTQQEHYIKPTPVLAVRAKDADEMTDRVAVVRDRIVGIVAARSSAELATPQGEAKLKQDILGALKPDFQDEIVDLYFTGYLVE